MDILVRHWRRAIVIAVHLLLIVIANVLAFALRFDGSVPASAIDSLLRGLPWLVAIRGAMFIPFGVYRGLWRYAGIWDLRNIIASVALSSAIFVPIAWFGLDLPLYPRSVYVIDALLLIALCGGLRFGRRLWNDRHGLLQYGAAPTGKKVLIFGAGKAGELIARDIRNNSFYHYRPVGFVDDDRSKVGQRIHGIPVLGTRRDLPRIMAEHAPDEVMVAMPAADPSTVRGVVRSLEPYKVQITSLPNLRDVMDGIVTVNQIRPLSVEDLLPRAPVGLDQTPLRDLLAGRRVLVTGAGGSIGSELCLQIAALRPETMVLYERSENSLYAVTNLLGDRGFASGVCPVLGDITEMARLEHTFAQYRPEIVFHAAAHKHVPLMESNPCEAVKNNVTGTRLVAEAAARHGVARMVLISTDKAVNPSSVMGATKRVAELVVTHQGQEGPTTFLTVRFGNVLGSNGSAIPRFIDQIKSGGPITITHPEIRRYFMLLPEAVQLVLHVAGLGRSGGTYVLDMGEQIKVADMARNLIRLSGLAPDEDIKLSFIGLRPGEKLFEELVGAREIVQPSAIPKVFEVIAEDPASCFKAELRKLERFARTGDSTETLRSLRRIVPEFTGRSWDIAPEVTVKLRPRTSEIPLLPMWRDTVARAQS
jgi:FlaA1/EpsC-like NDP-sugar epimerase